MKKKLDIYRGRLTPSQIAAGMNAAQANALRLVEDAELLLKALRLPSAAALAILSIEESGKIPILRCLALANSDEEILEEWKNYRSHVRKNVAWIMPDLVAGGARNLDAMKPAFDDSSDHPHILDQLKQLALYTDCLGIARWTLPDEVVDECIARDLVATARTFATGMPNSEIEVQLWIKHLGPVWKQDLLWMKKAIINWHNELKQLGLRTEGKIDFEEFVRSKD